MRVETISLKGSGTLNEDTLLAKKNIFAVFDGATDLNGYKNTQGKTGGFLASQLVKKYFSLRVGRSISEPAAPTRPSTRP